MPDDDQQQQQQPPINLADPAALTAAYTEYLKYLQQVGNQRPAQAPVISQAQLDANKPTSLLGQLGEALGGGAPSDVPMTSDQRERAGIRGLFNFSRGLLGTGTFDSIGQALDRGFTEAERGQYNQEAQVAYGQAAAQDWQRQQMADRLAALKESIPLLQGIQRLNMPSLYGPGGGPGAQAGNTPGSVPGAPGGGDIYSLPKAQFLQAVAQRESGGNPTILNYVARADPTAYARGATASGKYQMVNSTWLTAAKAAGIDTTKYPTAMSAPEELQDKAASALYDMQGTAPWNPAKFGSNWVQQPGGGYQLVKGAPYTPPTQVAQQPPAPPAQPAAKPSVPAGGGETAALPLPPQPPPGAVPTVTTPEEAKATAAAAGTPVQVPNTQGLWATPSGGMTSTPRLIMPGTDVASVTPTAPATPTPAPPPGVVTPAPQQQPAPTPAQPATPGPQTAPVRDLSKTDPHDFTLPEWQQYYRHVPTTDELVQRGIVLPQNAPEFRDAEQALTEAETNAANERAAAQSAANMAQRGALGQTDVTKAIQAATAADKNAQDAREKYNALLHDTSKTNATALAKYYTDQDAALAADYKAKVVDPANTARQQQQASDLKIHEGLVAAGTADDQKVLQGIDTTTESAHDTLATLEAAKQLSVAAGNKSALAVLAPGLATMLQRSGLLSQDESNKLDAQKALDGVLSKMAGTMRTSMGFSRMTNMDLQFLQNMVGTSNIPESQRNAMFAFMQTALERQYQYGALVREYYGGGPNAGGMTLAKAREAADDKLGHIVQTVPDGLAPDIGDLFVQQHVTPGTFYVRDGQLRIRGQ